LLFLNKILSDYLGPPELNFGEVCVNAPITKFLSVLNNLEQFILVQIDVRIVLLNQTKSFCLF